jgi:dolichyl-phosphate-mannose-protein mannosyltransferase
VNASRTKAFVTISPFVRISAVWQKKDTIALAIVTAIAGALRGIHLSFPAGITFDELLYAREACIYVYQSPELCGIPLDAVSPHPPLGKLIISLGVRAFGWHAFGWRIAGLIAGTATVALLYLLARRLLGTKGAVFAASLLAIDFLHFVYSRIAMIDTFLTFFVVASFLFAVIDRDAYLRRSGAVGEPPPGVLSRAFSRPWLLAAGLAAGAAIATKWVGLGSLAGVALLSSVWILIRPSPQKLYAKVQSALSSDWPALTLALMVAPVLIYIVSFVPITEGPVFKWPLARGSWTRNFARQQRELVNFHFPSAANRYKAEVYWVGKTHPDVSPAWSWPLIKRPERYYKEDSGGDAHRRIIALGSPLVWWTSLAALAYLGLQVAQGQRSDAAVVALIGISVLYLPFLLISGVRSAPFLHDILPSVPFMCLALATVSDRWTSAFSRWIVVGFATAAVAMFIFFYPVLTAGPLSQEALKARQWFQDCEPSADIAAPAGWCWKQ